MQPMGNDVAMFVVCCRLVFAAPTGVSQVKSGQAGEVAYCL